MRALWERYGSWVRAALARVTSIRVGPFGVGWEGRESYVLQVGECSDDLQDNDPEELNEIHEDVLVAIARSRKGALGIADVARRIGAGRVAAEHYLEVLEAHDLVEDVDGSGYFELTAGGRAYLVSGGLVS